MGWMDEFDPETHHHQGGGRPPEEEPKRQVYRQRGRGSLFEETPPAAPGSKEAPSLFDWEAEAGGEGASPGLFGEDEWPGAPQPGARPSVWELAEEEDEAGFEAGDEPVPEHERPGREKPGRRRRADKPPKREKPPSRRRQKREKRKAERKRLRELSRRERTRKILLWAGGMLLALVVAGSVALGIFWKTSTRHDALWLDLAQIPYKTETLLYATNAQTGEVSVYATLPCTQNKEYVDGSEMPQYLRDAFVAVEDRKFYEHSGVDVLRTGYAILNEAKHVLTGSYIGGDEGRRLGASTINQQLVKNLTRDDEDSSMAGYLRKLREVYRAWKMDSRYEKDEILSAYLNTISFTGNTAGVQAEAKKLFGKTVDQLSLAECASLTAITRNPARYNPVTHPEEHLARRSYVLDEMLAQGYIGQAEHDAADAEPLVLAGEGEPRREQEVTSYFTDAVMDEVTAALQGEYGLSRKEATNLLYNGGLRIYTTVVPELQAAMEATLEAGRLYPQPTIEVTQQLSDEDGAPLENEDGTPVMGKVKVGPQAAMVSLDYEGGVCAVVGGLGEKTLSRGFNRGTRAVRQVGSTMKGIAPYALALEQNKITWSSAFLDDVVRQEEDDSGKMVDWPANVDRVYSGRDILVREAFARSVNTVAVRVGDAVGNRAMYRFVTNELGVSTFVSDDADSGPLVLGSSTYGISPLEMARAYAMHGNGGVVPTVHTYTRITGGTGEVWMEKELKGNQAIGADTAFIMNRLMGEVLASGGTAAGMRVPGEMDSVGKTGTTSDNRDHWFIGLTPYYVTASWYGYDENVALSVNNSAHPPTLAWREVMQKAQAGLPYKEFPAAEGVEEHSYCTQSGYDAGPNCPSATGWYKVGTPPKAGCPQHG